MWGADLGWVWGVAMGSTPPWNVAPRLGPGEAARVSLSMCVCVYVCIYVCLLVCARVCPGGERRGEKCSFQKVTFVSRRVHSFLHGHLCGHMANGAL